MINAQIIEKQKNEKVELNLPKLYTNDRFVILAHSYSRSKEQGREGDIIVEGVIIYIYPEAITYSTEEEGANLYFYLDEFKELNGEIKISNE